MNGTKNILIIILVAVILIIAAFFVGQWTKKCPSNQAIVIDTKKDTLIAIVPAVEVHDTLTKYRKIYLPGEVDSSLVNLLFKEREELAQRLDSMKVKSIFSIDTLYGINKDTLKLRINDFSHSLDLYLGISPRKVQIETRTLYLPPPPKLWYENPYVTGGLGVVFGAVIRSFVK